MSLTISGPYRIILKFRLAILASATCTSRVVSRVYYHVLSVRSTLVQSRFMSPTEKVAKVLGSLHYVR
jgi:hypothetical protein